MIKVVHSDYYWYYDLYRFAFPLRNKINKSNYEMVRPLTDYITRNVGIDDEPISIKGQNSVDHVETYGIVFDSTDIQGLIPFGVYFGAVETSKSGQLQKFSYFDGESIAVVGEIWKVDRGTGFAANVKMWEYISSTPKSRGDYYHRFYYREAQATINPETTSEIYCSGWGDLSVFTKIKSRAKTKQALVSGITRGGQPLRAADVERWKLPYPNYDLVDWGKLAMQAVDDVGFTSNGIAYMKDYTELGSSVVETAKSLERSGENSEAAIDSLLKQINSINPSATDPSTKRALSKMSELISSRLKDYAGLYLSIHYGYKLFVSDTKELLKALSDESASNTHQANAMEELEWEGGIQTNRITINYSPNAQLISDLDRILRELDLDISLNKAWDLTPWSFVVDWFSNLSGTLEEMDSTYAMQNIHRINYVIRTRKWVSDPITVYNGYRCNLYIERYTRIPDTNVLYRGINLPLPGNPSDHWFEGGALYVANSDKSRVTRKPKRAKRDDVRRAYGVSPLVGISDQKGDAQMSTSKSWSSSPTGTPVSKDIKPWNWENWLVRSYSDNKIELVNPDSIVEAPTKVTRQYSSLSNIYNNTGLNPAYFSVNKTGTKLYSELRNNLKCVTPSTDGSVEKLKYLPVRGASVFDIPNDADITKAEIQEFIDQYAAHLADSAGEIADQVVKFRYGSLQP